MKATHDIIKKFFEWYKVERSWGKVKRRHDINLILGSPFYCRESMTNRSWNQAFVKY